MERFLQGYKYSAFKDSFSKSWIYDDYSSYNALDCQIALAYVLAAYEMQRKVLGREKFWVGE